MPRGKSPKDHLAAKMRAIPAQDVPRIFELPLNQLLPRGEQPRKYFDEEGLQELANSIEQHGLLQPVTVRPADDKEHYYLVAGERRVRAHQLLGRDRIWAILTQGYSDEVALIENIQREDLTPIEEAEAMARMMAQHGYTQEELASIVGKARATVAWTLKLNELPEAIKEECVTSHNVSKSLLIEIVRAADEKEQLQLWEAAKAGATVKQMRQNRDQGKGKTSQPKEPEAKLFAAGKQFRRWLGQVDPEAMSVNSDQLRELDELRDQLEALINRIHAQQPPAEGTGNGGSNQRDK